MTIEELIYIPYVRSIIIFAVFFLISKIVVFASEKIFMRLAKKTKTKVDDLIIEGINGPISWILVFIGIKLALISLGLSETVMLYVGRVLNSLLIFIAIYAGAIVINILIDAFGKSFAKKTKSTLDDHLIDITHKFVKILFIVIIILAVLNEWGIQVGPLLASLGIAGLAVAFALQSTLGNIFGGLSLILDRSLKVGDVVYLDANTKGTVLDVGLRSTRLRTFDNEMIIIPNGKLADMKIQNIVEPDPSARAVIPFSVAYGTDVNKVKKIVVKEVQKIEGAILTEPEPIVRFLEMGDSALKLKLYFKVEHYSQRFGAIDHMNELIYNVLRKNKIEIPYPQMDIRIKK